MATLLSDDFNRANNASTPDTPTVGGPYQVVSGTWGINNNQLYLSALTGVHHLLAPAASDVDFTCLMPLAQGGSTGPHSGIMWRVQDSSNSFFTSRSTTGNFAIFRAVGGSDTRISQEFPSNAGDVHRIVCFGRFMWFYINSVLVWTQEDMRYDPTNNNKIGFRNGGSSTTGRWDNAVAVDATADPTSWGADADADLVSTAEVAIDSAYDLTPTLYKGRDTALQDEAEIP